MEEEGEVDLLQNLLFVIDKHLMSNIVFLPFSELLRYLARPCFMIHKPGRPLCCPDCEGHTLCQVERLGVTKLHFLFKTFTHSNPFIAKLFLPRKPP